MKVHSSAWLLIASVPAVAGGSVGAAIDAVVAAAPSQHGAAAPTLFNFSERHLRKKKGVGNSNKKKNKGEGNSNKNKNKNKDKGEPGGGSNNNKGGGGRDKTFLYGKVDRGEPDDMPGDWKAAMAAMKKNKNIDKGKLSETCDSGGNKSKGNALGGNCDTSQIPLESLVIDTTDPEELEALGVNVTDPTTEGVNYEFFNEDDEEPELLETPDDEYGIGIGNDDLEQSTMRLLRGNQKDENEAPGATETKTQEQTRRKLGNSVPTAPIGDFATLACNVDLASASCGTNLFSTLVAAAVGNVVTVPCGACYTYDLPEGDHTIGGLDVVGKLYVPPNHVSALYTPFVFVQGEFEMSDTNPLSIDNESMKIVLTGDADVAFSPADSNANVAGTPFNAGTKPFLVAGGKLNIRGWDGGSGPDDVVQSWSPLVETAEGALPIPTFNAIPGQETAPLTPLNRLIPTTVLPEKCPRAVVQHDFESEAHMQVWSGGYGNIVHHENGALVGHDLRSTWHGFTLDFTEIAQECPLIDEATYLITVRIKIEHKDHVSGTSLQCEIDGQDCPRLYRRIYHGDGSSDATEERYIPRGVVGRYGEWFYFATTWQFKSSENELGSNVIGQTFTLERFPPGSKVSMDDFVWELPSEKSFLSQDGGEDTCAEVVINGNAEDNDGGGYHWYPMYSSDSNRFLPLVLEEDDGNGGINRFYRTKARTYRGHSMRWHPNSDCFVRGYVFTVSHKMRISNFSKGPMTYELRFKGVDSDGKHHYPIILRCAEISVGDGWKECSGPLLITEEIASLIDITVEVHFPSDKESTEFADVDWDDVSIAFTSGPAEGLTVQLDRASRWGANSEVHITSSTLSYMDSQMAMIDSITPNTGTTTLKLTAGIEAVLSEKETPGMGVEVAILTRNLKIEAEYTEGVTTEYQGGYLQILHTPGVAQVIEGVEFNHMGQSDTKNRHPIQLLYTKDVAGTSISRNSIRNTNYGCIWLDGVSNVTASSNVAHNSLGGDCFSVGYEATDNLIVGNLLSYIRDNNGFSIKSPENDFIANVAAGIHGRGFEMSLDWKTYGEDDKSNGNLIGPGGSMRRKAMGLFRDNTAHSSLYQGFRLHHFEQFFTFYNEVDVPIFQNMKAYRNKNHGIYAYNVIAAEWRGGLLSDNQWGINLRVSDRLLLKDYDIVGSSEIFKDHTNTRSETLCGHSSWDHTGIVMPSALWRLSHNDPGLGIRMRNITLSGFDKDQEWYPKCKSTEPIQIDDNKIDGHFDYVSSTENVNIVDEREPQMLMDGCLAVVKSGATDIVITDVDGSLDPDRAASVGSLVSSSSHVTDIFGDLCVDLGNCMAYCPGVCLRGLYLKVEQFGTENWKLKIKNTVNGNEMLIPSTVKVQSTAARSKHYFSDPSAGRRFSVSLPAGTFTAEFLDENGDPAWPTYVEEVWQKEPDCSGFATFGDITILKPNVDCNELIRNGGQDAVLTTDPWLHNMYDYWRDSDLAIGTGLGIDGSDAIGTYMRTDHWDGLGQDIDSRCLDQMKGEYYEFSAWMRVTEQGAQPKSPVDIDPNGSWNLNRSPVVTLFHRKYRDEATKEFLIDTGTYNKAEMSRTYTPSGWNLLHGLIRLPDSFRSRFEIAHAPNNLELLVDNASFTKMICDPDNLLLNGDLETGNSKYWSTWGGAVGLEIVPGYNGGNALKSFNRAGSTWHNFAQTLNLDCVNNAWDRLSFSAKIKIELNGDLVQCNPYHGSNGEGLAMCPDMYLHTDNGQGKRHYEHVGWISTSEYDTDNGWYLISGLYSLRPTMVGPQMYSKLLFLGTNTNYDVVIDNAQIKHLPKQCDALIENSSLENGALYWQSSDRWRAKVSLYSPGASGEDDFAYRAYQRDHSWRGIRQKLDPLCFVSGEEYSITAKFRLLNATDGKGVMCDVNRQHTTNDVCPSVSIYGFDCPSNTKYWRFYNALGGDELVWDPDSYNDFSAAFTVDDELSVCNDVWVYIHEVNKEYEIVLDDLQISSYQTDEPTHSPTPGETEPSTEADSEIPTSSPTIRPTVATVTSCPIDELTPSEITSGPVMLARSSSLCVLTKAIVELDGNLTGIAPVALSYDGGDWENAAGDFANALLGGQEFGDYSVGSHITLPDLPTNQKYYLTSYSRHVSETDKLARLLESATFGTTAKDLADWTKGDLTTATAKEWIQDQMSLPVTSHRDFFRQRTNTRLTHPVGIGRSDHPCGKLSRWRNFAFSSKEGASAVNEVQIFEATYDVETDTYITILLNGHVRTVISPDLAFENSEYTLVFNKEYEMCGRPEEYVDGRFWLRMDDDSCQILPNPVVHFYFDSVQPETILTLPAISESVFEPIDELKARGGEYILFDGLSDSLCDKLNDVHEEGDPPVFGQLPDGSWLQFDPILVLQENTLESHIDDGGGLVRSLTADITRCSNAPRTFLNEQHCTLSDSVTACGSSGTPNLLIDLNSDNIMDIHTITGQYVYGVLGLPLIDAFSNTQPWPCEPNLRTRWEILGAGDCAQTSMGSETLGTLSELLVQKGTSDENPLLRDIIFPITGSTCDSSDSDSLVEVEIVLGSQCFRRVHPEHMSVYDFTYWTLENTHPGNMIAAMEGHAHPIKKWMDDEQNTFLNYPAFDVPGAPSTLANHPITRWDNHSPKFSKLGRYGDTVKFVDLPNEIRLDEVAEHFGADTEASGGGIMVCGSPFESANDPRLGKVFHAVNGRDTNWDLWRQREYTWIQVGLDAPDQLRQRVAWALAQLLVIARGAIGVQNSHSEVFLNYYDIFTRGAFGNYRDILREISYSPLMAENLSFLQSKSAAYTWETQDKISFADENFSREIMQLFSTGLVKLNLDGTPMLDDSGNPILAYTNDEIMSFARVWTGFDYQRGRGNVEETSWSGNRHDPMKIQSGWRDKFPKTDMTGGYIGDGYPLCVDLPDKMFLRKGATYRLIGASHMPELMEDDSLFENDITLKKFVLHSASALKAELCNVDTNGACHYANTVTLDTTLTCTDKECNADALRVVQVNDGIHYEYVRPPCVEQVFYANAKKVIFKDRSLDSSCANPLLPYASEACCEGQQDIVAERSPDYLYDQERVLYSTADSRCDAMGMGSCDFNAIEGIDSHKKGYHWTTDSCAIQVKINREGQVALVYEPDSYAFLHPHVRNDNRNFFKVYWDGDYPKNDKDGSVGNTCGNGICQSLVTGGCLCDTTITESRVFKEMPNSVAEVLTKLTIGWYDTDAYDSGSYSDAILGGNGVTAYLAASTGAYDTETVFEVMDDYGRLHRFKNTKEHVRVKGASQYAFRNAPSFMSVLNSEADARDALYETEAALDHYFYHDNVAPFIAFRMIQRFTTSNPKPRYVKAVATAFRTGRYEGIGSNEYGDLAATIAAVLLHPEARSVNLDADPFKGNLREPLLKVMALMRGMELQKAEGQPVVRMNELDHKIGQMAHSFPTVFSFMLPEYSPGGRPGNATLVGPETMIMDMPKVVGLLNGMFSLVKYGLSQCYGGFGTDYSHCNEGDFSRATAHLSFSRPYVGTTTDGQRKLASLNDHAEDVVSELSTLLTSGRLGAENKQIIMDAYIAELNNTVAADPSADALRLAQQLVLTTPEFHTTNVVAKTGALRAQPDPPQASGSPYKAIVYVMFGGGCDSFNMLVPHTCSGETDLYTDEYLEIRQEIALQKEDLNELNGPIANQACETFGVHPQLLAVQELFNNGDLLFFANTGVLTKETDKENYWKDTETQLFAHNFMQLAAQRIDPLKNEDGTGVLGRIRDVLTNQGLSVGAFSIDVNSISLIGKPGLAASPMILSNNGVAQFNHAPSSSDMNAIIESLNGETKAESGVFGEWYSDVLLKSLSHNQLLYNTLEGKTTTVTFPNSHLGRQLGMVARMIDSRIQRGTDADMFYLSTGGWDTHSQVLMNQNNLFANVDASFKAFADEMKAKNVWDSVTLIETSDFARTLTQNGGLGSDHAWGGNYIMMGGDVKGGQIVGRYPDAIKEGSPLNIGRGRIIPTTSWEAVFLPLAEWAGVDKAHFGYICPNKDNFGADHFFDKANLFEPTASS